MPSKHTHRKLSALERRLADEARRQFDADYPDIRKRDRGRRAQAMMMSQAFKALRALREEKGLSLADVADRCGIDRSNLNRLETAEWPNPTMDTLARYAAALGVEPRIAFVETGTTPGRAA